MRARHFRYHKQRAAAGGNERFTRVSWRRGAACLMVGLSLAGSGCRGGVRSLSAPKWPGLSGAKAKGVETPTLASVPTSDAPIKKPSASAAPYPTTSTPAGYVVNDPAHTGGVGPDTIQTAATDPAAVTYGVTPSLAPPAPAVPAESVASTPAAAASPAGIAPQVGPYATLPAPPAAAETPTAPGLPAGTSGLEPTPLAAAPLMAGPPGGGYPVAAPAASEVMPPPSPAPTASAFPATAGYEPSARVADARGFGAAAAGTAVAALPPQAAPATPEAAPPLAPIVDPGGGVPSRYASQGSRYGGPMEGAADPVVPLGAAAVQESAAPAAFPTAPATPLPPAPLPAGSPDGLTSPPVRRPDPVFRPGGTSSYRPAEQIFVDEQPVAPAAVRTASYEMIDPLPPPAATLR